jgi:membrane protein
VNPEQWGRATLDLLRETAREWSQDNCLRLGAALSYYTLFSLAPLLVIAIAVAALAFGEELARGEVMTQVESLIGPGAAATVRGMIEAASRPRSGIAATVGGLALTALGASGVFGQLQRALNDIWDVPRKTGRGVRGLVWDRLTSFSMILAIGFLLLVSLGIGAALSAFHASIAGLFPGAGEVARAVDVLGSFAMTTLLFAMIFKVLPDAKIRWGDVWIGAAFTAGLFALGRFAIGFYLGRSSAASIYGAANSLVVILLWVYYSSQMFFFGAEFTQVYARRYGSLADPDR